MSAPSRVFGYKPDPHNAKDRTARGLFSSLGMLTFKPPLAASVESPIVRPKNQLSSGSCTGQAAAQAFRLAMLARGQQDPGELSALFNYYFSRAEFTGQYTDEGSYLRCAVASLVKFGICPEVVWPFSIASINDQPGVSAHHAAHDLHGARTYHRVEPIADDVKRAIALGFPVIAGWSVDTQFIEYDGDGVLTRANPARVRGKHAMVITSYVQDAASSRTHYRLLNSWDTDYGRDGYAVVDDAFVESLEDGWIFDLAA